MEAVTCIGEAVIGTAAKGVFHVTGRVFKFKTILKHLVMMPRITPVSRTVLECS